jgi:hypothetical protein
VTAFVLQFTDLNRKKYTFYEGEDLSCCAVSFVLGLALADNAFKNKFKSLRGIYDLIVTPDSDRIKLEWDEEWAERPIFRDTEITANGVRISKTESFQYSKYRYYFVHIGRAEGYEKTLELYGLQRGSGKELNGRKLILYFPFPPSIFAVYYSLMICRHRCSDP